MYLNKIYHTSILLLAFVTVALEAQINTNGTGGGAWNEPTTWATTIPTPTQNFHIVASDTVTANNLGTIINQTTSLDPQIQGTLNLGEGTTLIARRLNSGVVSTGTINISGGQLSIDRLAHSSGSSFILNLHSGSFTIRGSTAVSGSGYTLNINGGILDASPSTFSNGIINLTGGTLQMRNSISGLGSLYDGGSWNGGTLALNGSFGNSSATSAVINAWQSNAGNILQVATQDDVAQSLTFGVNVNAMQSILALKIYSATDHDNDRILVNGNTLSMAPEVQIRISGAMPEGSIADYIGSTYRLIETTNYSGVQATIADHPLVISGIEYEVQWQNNLSVDGTVTLISADNIPVSGVTVSPDSAIMQVGDMLEFSAEVVPADAHTQTVQWSSNNSSVLSVNSQGVATAHKAGNAIITATTVDGGFTSSATVEVPVPLIPIDSVHVYPEHATLSAGQHMVMTVSVLPGSAWNLPVVWSSSDESVAVVDEWGVVTAVANGNTNISATIQNETTAQSQIVVTNPETPPVGVSQDAWGWTVITPSLDSRVIYVSSSTGNDANDGLSPETAKRTIQAGNSLIRDGFPDHLLLKRGDVFDQRSMNNTLSGGWKNGRSAQEPVVMSYYGSSGPRPQILVGLRLVDHNGSNRDYQAYIGLEVYRIGSDPASPEFDNQETGEIIRLVGGGRNIIIEDCHTRFGQITIQNFNGNYYYDIKVRRNIVVDAWRHGTSTGRAERSGLFMSSMRGSYVIEENLFDHNGWNATIEGAGANAYNHNVYIQYTNVAGGIMRGNIFARGSSHGIQARSGGIMERNLFTHNAISFAMGGQAEPTDTNVNTFDNHAHQNVVLSGRRMNVNKDSQPQTSAVWGITTAFFTSRIEDNIVANRVESGVNTAFGGTSFAVMANNISYAWDASWDTQDASWPHPAHDLGDYFASLGGESSETAAYLEWLRSRPLRTLPWEMTSYAAINYIRYGFNKHAVNGYYQYALLAEEEEPVIWAGITAVDGWVNTGIGYLGDLYVVQAPWVYSDILEDWFFLPEAHYKVSGSWVFGLPPEPLQSVTLSWHYSESLKTWLFTPSQDTQDNGEWFYLLSSH